MSHSIYKCTASTKGMLINFIREHWKESHIFVKGESLFDYLYKAEDGDYNFFIGINSKTGEIDGIIGYIPISHFDKELNKNDAWGTIWRVRADISNDERGMLGLNLLNIVINNYNSFGAIGISDIAYKIYKIKGYHVGTLSQYYIKNDTYKVFKLARFSDKEYEPRLKNPKERCNTILREVTLLEMGVLKYEYYPKKTLRYFENRYVKYPIYKYSFLGVFKDNILNGVFVCRNIVIEESKCIRIVDFYGDLSTVDNLNYTMQTFLQKENAEYIDFMNYGIPEDVFCEIGFYKADSSKDEVIIPHHFEPFEKNNVVVKIAYKNNTANPYVIFKGDSDLDRPNIL